MSMKSRILSKTNPEIDHTCLNEINLSSVNDFLEKEKNSNKNYSWNKLDKTDRVSKLNSFSEKYAKENNYSREETDILKKFLITSLEKNKFKKAKDVVYDKEKRELISIPSLFYNTSSKNFTLRMTDTKRVSTLKSLTPKRDLENILTPTRNEEQSIAINL